MPTCDQIMDADATAQLFDPNIEPIPGVGGLEPSALPGPAAQTALASATVSVSCMWGIPNSDGGFHGVIAQLDPTVRDELIAALEASSYERGTVSGAPSYGADFDDEILGYSVHYTFEGDAWVIVMGTLFHQEDSVPVAERALAALHAVNP
ncbi:hypothetical protein N3K63_03300 [Microbacterium sp. W1N]|uniref:hypothetical protein n=1 Tax=Microbacterium festucae TaxID=2977531 RepID=UPI0021C24997|nr:hypothetical protein [Microbacterium festucae]MCT9819308.1 hypothetical protein [Microbacterium festucae]